MIAATVTVVLFLPLWAGFDTFRGVRMNGAPGSTGSTPTMLLEASTASRPAPIGRRHVGCHHAGIAHLRR